LVTIRDIAKEAGVSPSTASRALNKNPHISKKTIDRIQEIADKLGYLPDYNAKNLTTGEASAVGVIFPVGGNGTPSNPFYVNVLSGVNDELIKRGYALSVAITKSMDDLRKNVKSMVYQSKIKRFILLYSQKNDPIAKFLRDNNLRFVVIGQPMESGDFYVDNNNVDAGAAATRYLIETSDVENLAFVHSKNNWIFEQQRFEGFKRVMNERDLKYVEVEIEESDNSQAKNAIFEHPNLNGAVATDDLNAMNFVDTFNKVYPLKDLEMIGFNNSLPHVLLEENYKTMDLFPEEMGVKAALLLFSDNENTEINDKHHLIVGYKVI
jgi:LacI family transcriptional regulator